MKDKDLALIVDDDEELRDLISFNLTREMGYQTHLVENTAAARAWLEKHEPALIILDVMMPGGNGLDLCRWIRAEPRLERVPVLMTSAIKDLETTQDALELGAVDFMSKPFTLTTLKEKIGRLRRS